MSKPKNDLPAVWWAQNLEEIDREIVRLATLCGIQILAPGVVERVLHNDASVCGKANQLAFAKLRNLIMLHFAVREQSADVLGQTQTAQIEQYVIERLKKVFPDFAQGEPRA